MLLAAVLASGCYAEEAPYTPVAAVQASDNGNLIEISPGVEVVADIEVPIFFADDLYWWNYGGIWYQSGWYGGGWVRAPHVPPHIGGIVHPEGYAHYRPEGWTPRGPGGPSEARTMPSRGGVIHSRPAPHGGGHVGHR